MRTVSLDPPNVQEVAIDTVVPHLLRATQHAALACQPWIGRGDANAADQAAVSALRQAFAQLPGTATVVIGEGEKDAAPMLYRGEVVGLGGAPAVDLAIDPLENTKACARDTDGAITVVAAAPSGTLWGSGEAWYMDKLVVGPAARDVIDISRPVEENLAVIATATGKAVHELRTVVLDKARRVELIARIRATGAAVSLIPDGDVAGALEVLAPDGRADALMGVGGAPEGVITACAVRVLGGGMQARLAPQSDVERDRLIDAGHSPGAPMTLEDIVTTDQCCMVVTSVTWGSLQRHPLRVPGGWRTRSFVASPLHPRLVVDAVHTG